MQMHVGAVEQRVALRQDRNHTALIEMGGYRLRRRLVEARNGSAVVVVILVDLDGDRIDQRQLDHVVAEMCIGDGAGVAIGTALGEMRDHVSLGQRAHGLERQKFGIAGPGADADEATLCSGSAHTPGLASELRAAAVMALPPRRPRTMA